jgi:hypothetical protein
MEEERGNVAGAEESGLGGAHGSAHRRRRPKAVCSLEDLHVDFLLRLWSASVGQAHSVVEAYHTRREAREATSVGVGVGEGEAEVARKRQAEEEVEAEALKQVVHVVCSMLAALSSAIALGASKCLVCVCVCVHSHSRVSESESVSVSVSVSVSEGRYTGADATKPLYTPAHRGERVA